MLVMGIHPGHDGAVAVIEDRKLRFCIEGEKDSFMRHAKVTPMNMMEAVDRLGQVPDVVAMAGSYKEWFSPPPPPIGVGYFGAQPTTQREGTFCGKRVTFFSGSHIRTHIMSAAGMAPPDDAPLRAMLCWEGYDGSFYLLDERWNVVREIPVLLFPGGRYAKMFEIAEPHFPDETGESFGDNSGKLMALAAYADPSDATAGVVEAIDRLMGPNGYVAKGVYRDAPFYNQGVESDVAKAAAALIHYRMFETFATVAQNEIPPDIPLYIAGGCGLNCDWNEMFRELGHFSSVFVPPCANDSGSAIGVALDALHTLTGDPRIEWDVYCGLEFEWDEEPDSAKWRRRPMREAEVADAIASGSVVAWVQGRYELGPRALGNRSLLAEPFHESTKDLLNDIKLREGYRPIAPCCRIEDVGKVYDRDFHDPYMLHFRMATTPDLKAVTHVDGSARVQTVTKESNKAQHDLLSAFAERHGVGVLCNTSLNFKGMGFINRMSDLERYCERQRVSDMVVGDAWFQRIDAPVRLNGPAQNTSLITKMVEQHVPEGSTVLVISEGVDSMLDLEGRFGWHFPQNEDGSHQGYHPADSQEAIAKLEELREKGASYLVIPGSDFWWLEFYNDFKQHLETRYRLVLDDGRCLILALEPAPTGN
jgi:hydroxymethyl cephem carbamoyltransferase